ncbi:hypothetical protein BJV78DRAFT_1151882 [Lactifluus subvellereus]|nr:hypothetical protein BJV78DRAFT_1151882 [Lactifluus subvellereus]
MDRAIEYRSKCKHFRTLIIGRANAGKTTLLKKVQSRILRFSAHLEKSDSYCTGPQGVSYRGITNAPNSMQLLNTNRPLLEADRGFFDKYGIGKVPVVAVFTQFDDLFTTAYGELRDKEKFCMKEAKNKKFERAQEKLKTNFIEPLEATSSRPSAYVRLDVAATSCKSYSAVYDTRQFCLTAKDLIDVERVRSEADKKDTSKAEEGQAIKASGTMTGVGTDGPWDEQQVWV